MTNFPPAFPDRIAPATGSGHLPAPGYQAPGQAPGGGLSGVGEPGQPELAVVAVLGYN